MTEHVARQLRRRRYQSYRCVGLDCGCRDTLGCRCHNPDVVTERYVDGYCDAARHLLAHGMTPAPNVPALRAMWRRGGEDQRLAMRLAELWEVAA